MVALIARVNIVHSVWMPMPIYTPLLAISTLFRKYLDFSSAVLANENYYSGS